MDKLPEVAKSFSDKCTKCGEERYHRVLSHIDEKSAKVQCEICGKKRTFKLPSAKKPKRAGVARSKPSQPALKKLEWQKLNEERGKEPSQTYSLQDKFSAKDKIQHPKFGVGFIVSIVGDRLTALFEEGEKTLVTKK